MNWLIDILICIILGTIFAAFVYDKMLQNAIKTGYFTSNYKLYRVEEYDTRGK